MFCKQCGKQPNRDSRFCTNCGHKLSRTENTDDAQIKPSKESSSNQFFNKVIRVVIIVGLLGWGAYSSRDDEAVEKNNAAISNYDSGNTEQALAQFQEALRNSVDDKNKIETLKNLGYVYSSEGQIKLAITSFKDALALSSNGSFNHYLISGEVAMLEDKPAAAQLAYSKALELEPNNFQINNALALFYMDIEDKAPQYVDYKKALEYAQRAAQETDLQIAKQNLGMAYYFNEKFQEAINVFSRVTLDVNTQTAYWLGLSYARNNDPKNAKTYLLKAIANGVEVPQEVHDYINNN